VNSDCGSGEMADAPALGAGKVILVGVRVPPSALVHAEIYAARLKYGYHQYLLYHALNVSAPRQV
jgi:hypothetical protein